MATVLCTNGLLSKTLAVVRSIGQHGDQNGIRTVVAEKTKFHTSGFSKYADKSLVYPNPHVYPDRFFKWLCETIVKEQIDFLFPMDDDVMDVVVPRQDELARLCRIAVPPVDSYQVAADKARTMRLAKERNVPHPATVVPAFDEVVHSDDLLALVEGMEFPLVLKPRFSSGSRGIRFANTPDELISAFGEVHQTYPNPLIQEAIPYGKKYDVCLCYDKGHVLKASFVQRELRNYPIERGPSTVRESVRNEALVEYSKQLLNGIPWHGIVEIEYMVDPRTGEPKLMEINPRYWASLHLAIECGVDFPWIQYQLAMGEDVEVVSDYQIGVQDRSILPGELLYALRYGWRGHERIDPPLFTGQIHDDIISGADLGPTFGFFLSALRYSLDMKMWKFVVKR